jgi:hypothetical protein
MAELEYLPTGHRELIRVAISMIILSTSFTVWRVVARFKMSPLMGWSDWFMILGAVCTPLVLFYLI